MSPCKYMVGNCPLEITYNFLIETIRIKLSGCCDDVQIICFKLADATQVQMVDDVC